MSGRDCLTWIDSAWQDIAPDGVHEAARTGADAANREDQGRAYSIRHGHDPQYVHLLFDRQASVRPDSTAAVFAGVKLTYYQLVQSANRLSNYLRGIGVGPETVVGVCLERGIDAIRCLLAILKAGGAYLPLDPSQPDARLAQMCEEVRPAVILTDHPGRAAFPGTNARLLSTAELGAELASQPDTAPETGLRPENLACVIYTPGSTGQPKAVAVPYWVAWWSPDPRPVIEAGNVHLGRNVRKQLRRGDERTTANEAFRRVAVECLEGREPRWLTDTLLETMIQLHEAGWAHGIEVGRDDRLIGGAFGVGVGCVLSGDSLFGRHPNAARVAVADMAARFAQAGGLLIDAQWDTPFLRSLGAELIPRSRYLSLLARSAERSELPRERLPARRLLPAVRPGDAAGATRPHSWSRIF